MEIVLTAVAAGLVGAAGPWVMGRIPEPDEPEDGKPTYIDLAGARFLLPGLASLAAGGGALVAWGTDMPALLPAWALVAGVGAWLAWIDARTRLLPFVVVAPLYLATLALVGLAAALAWDHRILLHAAIANVVVYLAFRLLHFIGRFFGGALGYGDVRLGGVLALVLGPLGFGATLVGIYSGFVIGAVAGVVLTVLKLVDRRSFAFGPYMLAGAVVGAVWGPQWYGG